MTYYPGGEIVPAEPDCLDMNGPPRNQGGSGTELPALLFEMPAPGKPRYDPLREI
jgi:hypothetical protein